MPAKAGGEEIQTVVYEVGKTHEFEPLRAWFAALYEVLLGQTQGPRFGSFVELYGIAETREMIARMLGLEADGEESRKAEEEGGIRRVRSRRAHRRSWRARPRGRPSKSGATATRSRAELLAWYDRSARALPWRQPPGIRADPYAVWLSEIMLQQTTVKAVIPYYRKFLARWPRVSDLAAADLDEVLAAWAGLGYYSRARNLHACAKAVAERHGGRFPESEAALLALPGIGAYTAAAIAAIAFDQRATAVDGNVERVVARLFAVEEPLPGAKARIKTAGRDADSRAPARRLHPGDDGPGRDDLLAALAILRASVRCRLLALPRAGDRGTAAGEGAKEGAPGQARRGLCRHARGRRGAAAAAATEGSARRDAGGAFHRLGGMPLASRGACRHAPLPADWRLVAALVIHTFTHFHLELEVYLAAERRRLSVNPKGCAWYPRAVLHDEALPSVMRKVLAHAMLEGRDMRAGTG